MGVTSSIEKVKKEEVKEEEEEEEDESPLFMKRAIYKIENNIPFREDHRVPTIDIEKATLTKDSVVNSVISQFVGRSNLGLKKYGTTLDRSDLSLLDWVQHTQEEMMDGILYLEKIKKTIIESNIVAEPKV